MDRDLLSQLFLAARKHTNLTRLDIGQTFIDPERLTFTVVTPYLRLLNKLQRLDIGGYRIYHTALGNMPKPTYSPKEILYSPSTSNLRTPEAEVRGALDWILGSSQATLRKIYIPVGLPGTLAWLSAKFPSG